jgi:hypothetical protein
MTTVDKAYEYDAESSEFMEDFEVSDEAVRRRYRPGRPISIPGALSSATLHTPRGPATLNLPAPVATLAQFRALEQAVNATTQRLNTVQAELMRVRRELAVRRRDQQGMGSSMLLFSLLSQRQLRDDLEGHTHTAVNSPPVLPAGGGGFASFLPFLLLSQPGIFGGSGGSGAARSRRAAIAEQILPLALPGPASQRLAVALINADRSTRRQAIAEQRMVEEAVTASGGRLAKPDDLLPFPTLHQAFGRLPADVQATIFKPREDPKKGSAAS